MMWPEPELRAIIRPEPEMKNLNTITDTKNMYRSLDGQDYVRIANGILINCWQTLFQVLVNFYENLSYMLRGSSKLFNMTHIS